MGRVKRTLVLPSGQHADSYQKAELNFKILTEFRKQLDAAVRYCKANNCLSYKAVSSGKFPMVRDPRTILVKSC